MPERYYCPCCGDAIGVWAIWCEPCAEIGYAAAKTAGAGKLAANKRRRALAEAAAAMRAATDAIALAQEALDGGPDA